MSGETASESIPLATNTDADALRDRAMNSLVLGIELFNRPTETGRVEAVLMLFHHSFEMLLKSIVFTQQGTVYDEERGFSFTFDTCLRIGQEQLNVLSRDDRGFLSVLDSLRDVAVHYFQIVSEDLLYVFAQGSVSLFDALLRKSHGKSLLEFLPNRVMSICGRQPKNLNTLVYEEFQSVTEELKKHGIKSLDVAARLRPLLAFTRACDNPGKRLTPSEVRTALENLSAAENWTAVFPAIAQMTFNADGGEIAFGYKVVKNEDATPVRVLKPGENQKAEGTIIVREVNILDTFNLGLRDLAAKLGLSPQKTLALVYEYDIQNKPEMFRPIPFGTQPMKRYSKAALDLLRTKAGDAEDAWRKHRDRFRKHKKDTK